MRKSASRGKPAEPSPKFVCPECGFRDPHPVRISWNRVCCRACQFVPPKATVSELAGEFLSHLKKRPENARQQIAALLGTITFFLLVCCLGVYLVNFLRAPRTLEDRAKYIVESFLSDSFDRLPALSKPDSQAAIERWQRVRPSRWNGLAAAGDPKIDAQVLKQDATQAKVAAQVRLPGGDAFVLNLFFERLDEHHEWLLDCNQTVAKGPTKY